MKVKYLPQIEAPFLTKIEFLKQVSHKGDDIKRTHFKNNMIEPDFHVYLKINNIENRGSVSIRFYRSQVRTFQEGLGRFQSWLRMALGIVSDRPPLSNYLTPKPTRLETDGDFWQTAELFQAMGRDLFKMFSRSFLSPLLFGLLQVRYPYFEQARKLNFSFGEAGKYFEYIIFIDRIENLKAGKYRYAVFLNNELLTEGKFTIHSKKK